MDLVILGDEVAGIPVLVPIGEVDRGAAEVLAEGLGSALDAMPPAFIVDLSRLRFMDSTGVHAVVDAVQRTDAYGGRLAVVTGRDHIHDVFVLTGTEPLVSLYRTREDAANALTAHHSRRTSPGR